MDISILKYRARPRRLQTKVVLTRPDFYLEMFALIFFGTAVVLEGLDVFYEFEVSTLIDDFLLMAAAGLELFSSLWLVSFVANTATSKIDLLKNAFIWLYIAINCLVIFILMITIP
ncbi:MAG: hypothetical protein HWN65_21295 [Candidatus Helarchaeota archaeon]|nr:hypothetical protein [Candidatus Helarchaeota archaeon]